jgi:hypothetical protein
MSWLILMPLSTQKSGITIFNDPTLLNAYPDYRASFAPPWQTLLGNKYVYFAGQFFGNLVASLSPQFSVVSGGAHPWHQLDKTYVHLSWAVLIGFYASLLITVILFTRTAMTKKITAQLLINIKVLILLAVSLIPALITTDAPHATRSLLFFVIVIFWVWQNLYFLSEVWPKKNWLILVAIFMSVAAVESGRYLIHYFTWFPTHQERYEIKLKETLLKNPAVTQKVVSGEQEMVLAEGDVDYNYILVAWYAKIPPLIFWETIKRSEPTAANLYVGEKVAGFTLSK